MVEDPVKKDVTPAMRALSAELRLPAAFRPVLPVPKSVTDRTTTATGRWMKDYSMPAVSVDRRQQKFVTVSITTVMVLLMRV